ncbi:hypothetical protein [Tenacibaculum aquimarinum]|uniref:hypothetical protein n=1 Tax=Tenacibaculum aquimarinum TaxID=2910675 RepID=UPI001F0AE7E4|nr:hypothetical protein [Tenacibaculum aquimarinum]MCH3881701.1 hypothetical protein [Tenacibaculum aquimarinum]
MKKIHSLVQKAKLELESLDNEGIETWGERKTYRGAILPISVEPKLRARALNFMNDLINLLEANNHSIKFKHEQCFIEMYGELTQINLRQKFYRKRTKSSSGYSTNTFIKSDDLEFQIDYSYRTGWIDKKIIKIEDYLQVIYEYIENKSKKSFQRNELRKIEEEKKEIQRKLDENKARLLAIENHKIESLFKKASDYKTSNEIRIYLKALEEKHNMSLEKDKNLKKYITWGYEKANEIDPLVNENDIISS